MAQKISAFLSSSGSSVQVASSVNVEGTALYGAGTRTEYTQLSAATISVNGVSLAATYHIEPDGLSVVVRGFDAADPNGTRLHEKLLLKPGERRVIAIRRAHGPPQAHFTIVRVGDGVQISADGT